MLSLRQAYFQVQLMFGPRHISHTTVLDAVLSQLNMTVF